MSEMVKRGADAICEAASAWLPEPLHRMAYEDMMRAAIAAMREPAEEMLEAGGRALIHPSVYMGGVPAQARKTAHRLFAAMIDAALKETDDGRDDH